MAKNSVLCSIPINSSSSIIEYYNSSANSFSINQNSIDCLDLSITDNLYNEVNFNNNHFVLILKLKTLEDVDRFAYTNTFESIVKGKYSSPNIPF